MSEDGRVLVIGGGVIGLSCAIRLRDEGADVTVLDIGQESDKASWAAAGMLSPLGEAGAHDAFLALATESLGLFPGFIAELEDATGVHCAFAVSGRLEIATTESRAESLTSRVPEWRAHNPGVTRLSVVAARELVPGLGDDCREFVWFPDDARVDPRRLLTALRRKADAHGVVRLRRRVVDVRGRSGRVLGVSVEDGGSLDASAVLVAAGAWSGGLVGLGRPLPVRPVRGQMLALTAGASFFRCMLHGEDVYVVPRDDRILLGATVEEAGFDTRVDGRAIRRLVKGAVRLVPALGAAAETERWAGLRPGTPDGLPVLGADPILAGLFYATGHFRNGILLAPVTASAVADLIGGSEPSVPIRPFSPARFGARPNAG